MVRVTRFSFDDGMPLDLPPSRDMFEDDDDLLIEDDRPLRSPDRPRRAKKRRERPESRDGDRRQIAGGEWPTRPAAADQPGSAEPPAP